MKDLQRFVGGAARMVRQGTARETATIAYGLACLHQEGAPPLQRACEAGLWAVGKCARARVGKMIGQGLANVVWAVATAQCNQPETFAVYLDEISRRPWDLSARDVAATLWAFTVARANVAGLVDAVRPTVVRGADEFNGLDLVQVAWSCSTASVGQDLLDAVGAALPARCEQLTPQGVAIGAWAFARGLVLDDRALGALADRAVSLPAMKPRDSAQVLWALAVSASRQPSPSSGSEAPPTGSGEELGQGSTQARVTLSASQRRTRAAGILQRRLAQQIDTMSSVDITAVLYAVREGNFARAATMVAIAQRCKAGVGLMTAEDISVALHSFAVVFPKWEA